MSNTLAPDLARLTVSKVPEEHEWRNVDDAIAEENRRAAKIQVEEEKKYEEFQNDADRLLHAIKLERAACQHFGERTGLMLQDVRDNTNSSIRALWSERNAVDTQLQHVAEAKVKDALGVVGVELHKQTDAAKLTREINDELCHLTSDLNQARRFRIEKGEQLAGAVRVKLDEIRDAIAAEKKIREESDATLLELFGEMGTKIQTELDNSREERISATDRLIGLCEEVLPQLEMARLNRNDNMREKLKLQGDARNIAMQAVSSFRQRNQ